MSSGTHFRRGSTVPFDSGPRKYTAGLGSVGSYQVSGVPWVTGSITLAAGATDKLVFPTVAKSITVINTDGLEATADVELQVHFNPLQLAVWLLVGILFLCGRTNNQSA